MATPEEQNKEQNRNMNTLKVPSSKAVFVRTSNSKVLDHQGNSYMNGPINYLSSYKWEENNGLGIRYNSVLIFSHITQTK